MKSRRWFRLCGRRRNERKEASAWRGEKVLFKHDMVIAADNILRFNFESFESSQLAHGYEDASFARWCWTGRSMEL